MLHRSSLLVFLLYIYFIIIDIRWLIRREISCTRVYRKPSGIITSLGYPINCDPACNTEWFQIIQPPGMIIMLNITNADLDCGNQLVVSDSDDHFRSVRLFNETMIEPWSFNSTTNYLTLMFVHNETTKVCKGFNAIYKTVNRKCGGLLTESKGTIKSPNYPNNYGNNENCIWIIKAPKNHIIMLAWTAFKLEMYNSDYVEVHEHDPENSTFSNRIGAYTGSVLPQTVLTNKRSLRIRFYSDYYSTFSGFMAKYKIIDASVFDGLDYKFL